MSNNILPFEHVENRKQNALKFYLEKLSLKNFRNHVELDLHVNALPILIYGDNGSGKTNILEAISLLNQGKGLRKSNLQDFLCQNIESQTNSLWGVNADIKTPKGNFNIGTGIKDNSSQKSRIAKVNSENFLLSTLDKIVKILWITPQMCMLFQSGMSSKRRFLDQLASSIDSLHLSRVYKFEALLRNRSKILMDHKIDEAWLDTIESQISELSVAITATRIDLINELNNLQNNELKNNLLTNNFPPVEVKLSGKVEILLSENPALEVENYVKLMLKKSRFSSENFNVGPNYTIIQFINIKKNKNTDFLSTGEQKLVLISLILAHARMLDQKFNMSPILLLDDIIEHLDKDYRKSLFEEIMSHQAQTWFTSTSKEAFDDYPGLIRKIDLLKVKQSNKAKYDFRHGEV